MILIANRPESPHEELFRPATEVAAAPVNDLQAHYRTGPHVLCL